MGCVVVSDLVQTCFKQDKFKRLQSAEMTVFCDFDGPILDVSDRYYNTYRLGLQAVQDDCRSQGRSITVHQLSKSQFWQMKQNRIPDPEIALRSGLQPDQIELFLQQVSQIVNQPTLLHQDQLQPGVRLAVELLHAQNVRLMLVTLRCQSQAIQVLQSYGLLDLFEGVWGATDQSAAYGNLAQHKTELLAAAIASCSWQHAPADSAWMVGDTEADVLAGQEMGLRTIALTCGIRSQSYLNKFAPTLIYRDLLSATRDLVNS
jgi:phosphoglycolate phosphatase